MDPVSLELEVKSSPGPTDWTEPGWYEPPPLLLVPLYVGFDVVSPCTLLSHPSFTAAMSAGTPPVSFRPVMANPVLDMSERLASPS